MNRGLSQALATLFAKAGRSPVHLKELGLDYSSRCNFQKLRYWGLVEMYFDPSTRTRKSGWWQITEDGADFLKGFIEVPVRIWTFLGDVVDAEEQTTKIFDVWEGYTVREDWAKEARRHDDPQMALDI
ncbi:MAG: hypothetical protein IID28_11485 [Planctomycetes bacterium]|nr:hypothetical protein [Planctomycetota bacterium]